MIEMFKPSMGDEEIEAVSGVIRSGWLGLGPRTDQFELDFARYVGSRFAVGLNSYTAALDTAMKLLGIGSGDEVIVSTIGFMSVAHGVVYNGATPVFADVLPDTLAIDPDDVASKITARTKAVVATHYAGRPCDVDRLRECTKSHGIRIIEDAANACGAEYKGKKVGTLGDVACFSFEPVQNLAMGDGGAITTDDELMAQRAKQLRWLGVDKETWDRTDGEPPYWRRYLVGEIALKCHMNDLMAAIGLVQLRKLDGNNARRHEIAGIYNEGLRKVPEVTRPPFVCGTFKSSWQIYPIQCGRRDALNTWLKERGVASEVHYTPLHTYSCYGNKPSLPVAEGVFGRLLSLPMYPDLSDVDAFKVVNAIKAFYARMKERSGFPDGTRRVEVPRSEACSDRVLR